jgi:hypothetical protein
MLRRNVWVSVNWIADLPQFRLGRLNVLVFDFREISALGIRLLSHDSNSLSLGLYVDRFNDCDPFCDLSIEVL